MKPGSLELHCGNTTCNATMKAHTKSKYIKYLLYYYFYYLCTFLELCLCFIFKFLTTEDTQNKPVFTGFSRFLTY